jgi:hypothetical protein
LDGKFPDKEAERHNPFRTADESGEDYLYPSEFFAPVNIPLQTKSRLNEKPPKISSGKFDHPVARVGAFEQDYCLPIKVCLNKEVLFTL